MFQWAAPCKEIPERLGGTRPRGSIAGPLTRERLIAKPRDKAQRRLCAGLDLGALNVRERHALPLSLGEEFIEQTLRFLESTVT